MNHICTGYTHYNTKNNVYALTIDGSLQSFLKFNFVACYEELQECFPPKRDFILLEVIILTLHILT
jgi:hypothetical protein